MRYGFLLACAFLGCDAEVTNNATADASSGTDGPQLDTNGQDPDSPIQGGPELDPSFGVGGLVNLSPADHAQMTDIAIAANGKLVLVGRSGTSVAAGVMTICRLLADGMLDTSFAGDGCFSDDAFGPSNGNAVLVTTGGDYFVAGSRLLGAESSNAVVWRISGAGALVTTFDIDGRVEQDSGTKDELFSIIHSSQGEYIAGGYTLINNVEGTSLIRFNELGVLTANQQTTATPARRIYSLLEVAGGLIVAAGQGTGPNPMLARYRANLTPDTSFAGGAFATVGDQRGTATRVWAGAGETLVVAEERERAPNMFQLAVRRFTAAGAADPAFGSAGITVSPTSTSAFAIPAAAQAANGETVVAAMQPGELSSLAFRVDVMGAAMPTFGPGGEQEFTATDNQKYMLDAIGVQPDGKIVLVLAIPRGNDTPTTVRVVRWLVI